MSGGQRVTSTDEDQMEVTSTSRVSGRDDDSVVPTLKPTRLSVNISRDTVEALQEIVMVSLKKFFSSTEPRRQ
ncbi:MAG: hypothetical protein WBF75_08065 [Pseudonocardiaceae bacterium]